MADPIIPVLLSKGRSDRLGVTKHWDSADISRGICASKEWENIWVTLVKRRAIKCICEREENHNRNVSLSAKHRSQICESLKWEKLEMHKSE